MSASDYRARADALLGKADGCRDEEMVLRLEAMALEWRRLAEMADWQDAMQAALAVTDEGSA
jgi:hypothetical protein